MASYNGNGRGRGPGRRNNHDARRRLGLSIEALEGRTLLTGGDVVPRPWLTNDNLADTQNGPMANAGAALVKAYFEYQQYQTVKTDTSSFATSDVNTQARTYLFEGDQVRVDVKIYGDLRQGAGDLALAGLTVKAIDSTFNLVEGLVPVSQLPAIAALPNVVNVAPIAKPQLRQQGLANNQAEQALFVDAARTQYGVTGAGIKVGVLSDSVDKAPNLYGPANRKPGIQGSIDTGDLPPSGVKVLSDGSAGDTDEGRAMLEQIYDLAPGAQLYFATAGGGPVNFANNIRALANAGCTVIVDDIGYANEPFFQDGVISQAIQDVAKQGVVYVSAAGNSAAQGYSSPVFGVANTTVGGVSGRFVNFNPSGTTYQMPMTIGGNGAVLFQFDQPFGSSNPAAVTSNVDILFFDAGNNLVSRGGINTIASQTPFQFPSVPATARSFAVQIISGPDIGHFQVVDWAGGFTPARQFGNAGGITYPTTYGHSATTNMISAGAVPWFGTAPVASPSPVLSEDFSSFGPVQYFFDASGNRLSSPQLLYKPDMSATDANNTSFFGSPPGSVPGGLATNNYSLPNFYGTSSAAPNLASVAVLMKQLTPNASPADIANALITSALATPLNSSVSWSPKVNTSIGTWDPQGGYGLISAPRALAAINLMRVVTSNPGPGTVTSTLPTALDVTYTFAVDPTTVDPGDIQVVSPPGTTVTVTGATVDANNPALVHYAISVAVAPGASANGAYTLNVLAGAVRSFDGKVLQPITTGSPYAYTAFFGVK
ncbi:MAG: S8 family serine peptidase [Isosphaeraceae bacterium]